MSKSLGNVVSPQQIIKTLGADILRLWVASCDYRYEMSLSDEVLKRTADSYRRLRNTARYLLSNLHDFDPEQHQVAWGDMLVLDQWAMHRAAEVQKDIQAHFEHCRFAQVVEALELFCINDMGGFYLDVTKDRQYTCQANSLARRSTQTAMYHIAHGLVRWLMPILSFTADEFWQFLPGVDQESVLLSQWYQGLQVVAAPTAISPQEWQVVRQVRDQVNKAIEGLRADKVLGSSLQASVTLYVDSVLAAVLRKLGDELRFALITSVATLADGPAPAEAQSTELDSLQLVAAAAEAAKCERCWHYCEDVGQHEAHAGLCGRCIENVIGAGEQREFV